jgi:pectinesterase
LQALKRTASCHKSSNCHRGERILSDDSGDGILLNDSVIVGPYGADNFTTITDAIAFAPNSSTPEDGYFVIFVREGIYEEYVVVPKNKKNIMMIGEGINRTIITGNHSVMDGWTTFNSSTFGKRISTLLFSSKKKKKTETEDHVKRTKIHSRLLYIFVLKH